MAANVVWNRLRLSDKTGAPLAYPLRINPDRRSRAKIRRFKNEAQRMDIERINLIGTRLADLTQRTDALRGYL